MLDAFLADIFSSFDCTISQPQPAWQPRTTCAGDALFLSDSWASCFTLYFRHFVSYR